jgi:hypothetical protein
LGVTDDAGIHPNRQLHSRLCPFDVRARQHKCLGGMRLIQRQETK